MTQKPETPLDPPRRGQGGRMTREGEMTKRALVEIHKNSGAVVRIPARLVGPLAVHLSVDDPGWTVTHPRTGYAVVSCVPDEGLAVRLAKAMKALPWDFDCEDGKRAPRDTGLKVLEILRAAGHVPPKRGNKYRWQQATR